MFAPSFDQSFNDIFNEYVNMDSNGDGNKEVPFSSDIDQLFPPGSLSSDCGDLSPIGSSSRHPRLSPQPWSKGLWCLQDDVLPSGDQRSVAFHDTIHPSVISDLSLSLESPSRPAEVAGLISTSPSTPPATPSRKPSKSAIITPKTIRRREPNDRRALLRKHSFSPSLMRSSHLQKTKMAYPEVWTQRLQNYHLRGSDERLPLSPPPSDILVQHETMQSDNHAQMHMSSSAPSGCLMRDSAEMPTNYDSNMFHQTSTISATQRQRYLSNHGSAALSASSPPSADEIFHSPHSSDSQPMPSWHADALGTPSMPFTPDLQSHDPQAWWSPMTSRVAPVTQGQGQNPYLVSPLPQRPIHNTNHHSDLLQGGLMINFDPSFDISSAPESSFSSSNLHTPAGQDRSYAHVPGPQQSFAKNSPFTTPRGIHTIQSSRSPSVSPITSPRSGAAARTATNLKAGHRRNHSRKLSSQSANAPKPVKAGSPNGNKSVSVSFVNFTPSDSQKILTGVAPSGSSKTKARREQEAREKRRKLSEAALMAVRKAGGDVEALEAVLC